jgi:hypothetical protein
MRNYTYGLAAVGCISIGITYWFPYKSMSDSTVNTKIDTFIQKDDTVSEITQ